MNEKLNSDKSTTINKMTIGKQKYKVVSHYIGNKNIDQVLEELALRKALYEYNYEGGYGKKAG